jgi:hypothetical protein
VVHRARGQEAIVGADADGIEERDDGLERQLERAAVKDQLRRAR